MIGTSTARSLPGGIALRKSTFAVGFTLGTVGSQQSRKQILDPTPPWLHGVAGLDHGDGWGVYHKNAERIPVIPHGDRRCPSWHPQSPTATGNPYVRDHDE